MKYQALFYQQNRTMKNYSRLLSATVLTGALKVKKEKQSAFHEHFIRRQPVILGSRQKSRAWSIKLRRKIQPYKDKLPSRNMT